MNEEKQVEGSILHVMNLITLELLRYGFMLAQQNELKDLKTLISTDEDNWMRGEGLICIDDELELLDCLEDVAIKQLMLSVNRIAEFKNTFLLINGLDKEEVILDDDFHEQAEDTYYKYSFTMECDGTYESILDNLHCYYWPIELILFDCVMQFVLNKKEVTTEAEEAYQHYNCTDGLEMAVDHKNARLLLDLLPELNKDANNIDEYYWNITKKD
ncbi:hypothetical protein HDC92_004997 [Pedobacter sp. AK017]|uniref:hypothetical protein n=1 Tax=Pedobacter sp. AK017 TaxID=2723073 RepID=UPI00161625C0|nr:hypothetical protein [Pedobacter sp. AK017]MBB5441290.1 hypothetical protein [Pedobacter sp. AK017]